MTGSTHDALYELDTSTGAAERVGTVENFGIGEGTAIGYRDRVPQARRFRRRWCHRAGSPTPARRSNRACTHCTCGSATTEPRLILPTPPPMTPCASRLPCPTGHRCSPRTPTHSPSRRGSDGTEVGRPVGAVTTTDPETDQPVGAVTATDPETDPITYSLYSRGASGSSEPVYMIGGDTNALYTVNIVTGEVTTVGNADDFGASITNRGRSGLAQRRTLPGRGPRHTNKTASTHWTPPPGKPPA